MGLAARLFAPCDVGTVTVCCCRHMKICVGAAHPSQTNCYKVLSFCHVQVVRQRNLLTSFLRDNSNDADAARRAYAQSVGRSPLSPGQGQAATEQVRRSVHMRRHAQVWQIV